MTCYLWLAICYLLSESFFLKFAITCKNLFLSLVVVRLVIFHIYIAQCGVEYLPSSHLLQLQYLSLFNFLKENSEWLSKVQDVQFAQACLLLYTGKFYQMQIGLLMWFIFHNQTSILRILVSVRVSVFPSVTK